MSQEDYQKLDELIEQAHKAGDALMVAFLKVIRDYKKTPVSSESF